MRVIAGTARRLKLRTIEGKDTRPTTDRIKETLFNMIQWKVPGAEFLDLFGGSGSIGIEALSRGARGACFVENNRAAAAVIRDNLAFTRLSESAMVMECDAVTAIRRLCGKGKIFDIIYMDPPYNMEWEKQVLAVLADSDILDKDTMIIIEADKDTGFQYAAELGFTVDRQKEYKTNKHVFLSMGEKLSAGENPSMGEYPSIKEGDRRTGDDVHEAGDISGEL